MSILELFSGQKRHIRKAISLQKKILEKESEYAKKTDLELQEMTRKLKQQLQNGSTLTDILPDAFANAREAAKRVLNEFPYEVQILGGILLHDGDIAEMKTGEGKTLTAVMPIYLNALVGKGAHVITVNEYLAKRDAQWMGQVYRFLGLEVGCNLSSLTSDEKRKQYACDITYTTASELGFDYLRDNMVFDKKDCVLRGLHYAILDEADSILIDESRTPLIISGSGVMLGEEYTKADHFAKSLIANQDYEIKREDHSVLLTESGIQKAEAYYGYQNIYNMEYADVIHYMQNALKANYIFHRDVEYVVQNNDIILVDQFTGRKMEGRQYSDGLHQAIQVKEGVEIKAETQTLATITYQNFFRLYSKLSGMTGTAKTEEAELLNTYNMRVFEIATHRAIQRLDEADEIFLTKHEKYQAIIDEVERIHQTGQPILIGTLSVETNEIFDALLSKRKIPHQILNTKDDSSEAQIIANAGHQFAVTVATNMAGRGTDIQLDEMAVKLGGLVVLGSERHDAKRIDNQLRGRSGRQGDPGISRFYVSLEDDLIVEFASDALLDTMKEWAKGKKQISKLRKAVDQIQLRAEGLHFDNRKNTLEYDEIMAQHRKLVYQQRNQVLEMECIESVLERLFESYFVMMIEKYRDGQQTSVLEEISLFDFEGKSLTYLLSEVGNEKRLADMALKVYRKQSQVIDYDYLCHLEKKIFLSCLDLEWRKYVDGMEKYKSGIHLQSYAQKKPSDVYREEAIDRFHRMLDCVSEQVVMQLIHLVSGYGEA